MKTIFLFLLLISCNPEKKEVVQEDYSKLIEIALNICPEVEKYYHFEIEERRTINLLSGKNSPLIGTIMCFDYKVNYGKKYQNNNSTWIEIRNYKKISANEFYLLYKIENEGVFVETTIKNSDGKWRTDDCKISETKSK
ncbi:hypothetical protein K0U91_13130 [Chryseobacterium chendengshani]|uniref:hypothetical protein n=1 Tax=Chryseobacterium sp. LJ668 TaxID=2864040 RepID=UPI001C687476|nr:hypothetical protein [Chryseobacterium sp. LJ668]MBW8522449.1 hypothetical protein [Chryseobacterium sp. LJ668]QYK15992.1 hypothetical protein K0U91_13130 [Chryseobacterium sp. LJ668]